MMSGDNFAEEIVQTRTVLRDLTNRPSKRELLSISDDLGFESGSGYIKEVVVNAENLRLAKQVYPGVENVAKEKGKEKLGDDPGNEKGSSLTVDKQASELSATDSETGTDTSQGHAVSIISYRLGENKGMSKLLDSSVNFLKRGTVTKSVDEVGDALRDSCASTGSMPANFWSRKKDRYKEGILTSDAKQKNLASDVCTIGENDIGVGRLGSSKGGSIELSMLPKSQGSKSFVLGRCTALKRDGCANLSAGTDSLKACLCCFCMEAAYIWSDLHYQDIKGRMGALKKSQKEASILVNKYGGEKQTEIRSLGNSNKSLNLESELNAQWKSLFQHMEDIFVHESNQLQSEYVALKDLKEHCKMDLERNIGVPSNKN